MDDKMMAEKNEDSDIEWMKKLNEIDARKLESPIDLNIGRMTTKILNPLIWCHYDVLPKKLKLTNTGKTVVLSANWHNDGPFIAGGPFLSKQLFSQIHFHWGRNGTEGSEHFVDGESFPMELHAVHYNSDYPSQEVAMRKSDGITILVYFFKLQSVVNPKINRIVDQLGFIRQAQTSKRIVPWPISNLLRSFLDDYFLYHGAISTMNYRQGLTWLVSREPMGISIQQVAEFRKLMNLRSRERKNRPMHRQEDDDKIVYHVNPSGSMYSSLLPISRSLAPPKINTCSENSVEKTKDPEVDSRR